MLQQWLIVLVVVPFLLGTVGAVINRMALGPKPHTVSEYYGWRRWFLVTNPVWFLVAGLGVGAAGYPFGIPFPDAFGTSIAGAMLAYCFAGGVSIVGYDVIIKVIKRAIEAIRIP